MAPEQMAKGFWSLGFRPQFQHNAILNVGADARLMVV